jgi:hypothetical protein
MLDVPRLNFHEKRTPSGTGSVIDRNTAARNLFNNYTKRASISQYVQSHGCIGARIINTVFDADLKLADKNDFYASKVNLNDPVWKREADAKGHIYHQKLRFQGDKDECAFWLYACLRESKLPLSFYNNMIEAGIVMGDVFNFLLSKLDEDAFAILGNIPGVVF